MGDETLTEDTLEYLENKVMMLNHSISVTTAILAMAVKKLGGSLELTVKEVTEFLMDNTSNHALLDLIEKEDGNIEYIYKARQEN